MKGRVLVRWEKNSYNNIGKTTRNNNGYYHYLKAIALVQPSGDKF